MHIEVDDELEILIRSAEPDDDEFILGLVERFTDFDLPKWRKRVSVSQGIRKDLEKHLEDPPPGSFMFVAEDESAGRPVGFIHLQTLTDFFTGHLNCHVSDLAVAKSFDGRGVGRALLKYAEDFARERRCEHLTIAAFPGNTRAVDLYRGVGFDVELLRMAKLL